MRRDPVEQRADILDRILAVPSIVEMLVNLCRSRLEPRMFG